MNKAPFPLSSSIRTICAERLTRIISIPKMQRNLIGLFGDRTEKDNVNLFDDADVIKSSRFMHCLSLNDERTIAFNQCWKQESDVFDEKRQIWISNTVNPIEDDLFIQR